MEEEPPMIAPQEPTEPMMRVNRELHNNVTEDPKRNHIKQLLKVSASVIGVCAAVFVLLARDGVGPPYFDSLGKAFFWTGMVLVPLFSLNYDVLRLPSGKALAVALFAFQLVLVFYLFGRLHGLNFIILTPLCFIQSLLYMLPFMLIRRRNTGIWY